MSVYAVDRKAGAKLPVNGISSVDNSLNNGNNSRRRKAHVVAIIYRHCVSGSACTGIQLTTSVIIGCCGRVGSQICSNLRVRGWATEAGRESVQGTAI